MKVKIRTKGDRLLVCDENGNEIEGVVAVEMKAWRAGDGAPLFHVHIAAPLEAKIDGEAEVESVPAPAAEPAEQSEQ